MATEATKTYRGNCHCGAFVYEAELPEIKGGTTCSCSMCFKKGTRIIYTAPKNVKFVKGDESVLTKYQFNTKMVTHMFCTNCGSPVLAKGGEGDEELYGLNANCIQGLDLSALEDKFIDGAALDQKRVPPPYTGPEPTAEIEGARIYHGSCTCGAVRIAVKCKDLHENPDAAEPTAGPSGPLVCNCSICARNGNVWIYPMKEQVAVQGLESLTQYAFNFKINSKTFCKVCGVNPIVEWPDLSQEHLDSLPEIARRYRGLVFTPVNVRVLDNFSLDGLKIKYIPGDHGTPYVNP